MKPQSHPINSRNVVIRSALHYADCCKESRCTDVTVRWLYDTHALHSVILAPSFQHKWIRYPQRTICCLHRTLWGNLSDRLLNWKYLSSGKSVPVPLFLLAPPDRIWKALNCNLLYDRGAQGFLTNEMPHSEMFQLCAMWIKYKLFRSLNVCGKKTAWLCLKKKTEKSLHEFGDIGMGWDGRGM